MTLHSKRLATHLIQVLLVGFTSGVALFANAQATSWADEQAVKKAINESMGSKGLANRLGLKNVKVTAGEAFLDYNKQPKEHGQVSTDGPTITGQAQISEELIPVSLQQLGTFTIAGTFMTNELVAVDQSKVKAPVLNGGVDWGHFFREAKVIFDVDPNSGNPVVTIIKSATVGVQDIESNAFDSQMPIPDNGALRGITRQRSAKAIRVDLNSSLFDSLSVALFRTGVYHPENFGDNPQAVANGATVFMTKNFSDRLHFNGAVTQIDFVDKKEIRINSGIAYVNEKGGYTVFYNRVDFKNNPLYPEATLAQTVGLIKQLGLKHHVTVEETRVNNGYRERAVGYKYDITPRTSVGIGVRQTQDGIKLEGRAAYSFQK